MYAGYVKIHKLFMLFFVKVHISGERAAWVFEFLGFSLVARVDSVGFKVVSEVYGTIPCLIC